MPGVFRFRAPDADSGSQAMTSGCSHVSQRSTRRRLRVEQKALRHSVRGAVHRSMRRVLGMDRSSTTSALEPSASVISLCQSSSFGHAQSCTGCLASPQFVRSRNRSGEPRHDHPHELASRIQMPTRVREQCQSPADADETPHCLQMHRTVRVQILWGMRRGHCIGRKLLTERWHPSALM